MEVFNVGKILYPNIDKEANENNSGDDLVETKDS